MEITRIPPAGLEPATHGLEGRRSVQLSYGGPLSGNLNRMIGAPGFEPGTSASQTPRAARLRHAPLVMLSLLTRVAVR